VTEATRTGRAQWFGRGFLARSRQNPRRSRWAPPLVTAAALGLLFLLVYGGTNQLTAHRGHVGSWVLPVDHHVPFVPALLLPYLSIDLFFVAAPFLCRDDRELRRLAGRMSMAVLVAGACFLAVPLRFAFARPPANALFEAFRGLDGPYNQFPSLHIALLVVLTVHYGRHARGVLRGLLYGWFALIAASTVLTYQHHVIDVAGGAALGWLCLFVFPDDRGGRHVNRRIGAACAAGAVALVAVAAVLRPWGAALLWPAVSMGVMAAECFGTGAVAHRKLGGRVAGRTKLLMAPVRAAQWLSWRYYARRSRPWDAVADGVWVGRVLRPAEAASAVVAGASAALDLTPDFDAPPAFRAVPYLNLPVPDLTAPTVAELLAAAAFIAEQRRAGRTVYVCCKAGYSRSATAAAAYLVSAGIAASADDAVAQMARARPGLIVRPEARAAIGACAQRLATERSR
jgi:membrane-associated phospholipid phosphatase/rhodanese-related sulfurtransferase